MMRMYWIEETAKPVTPGPHNGASEKMRIEMKDIVSIFNSYFSGLAEIKIECGDLRVTIGDREMIISLPAVVGGGTVCTGTDADLPGDFGKLIDVSNNEGIQKAGEFWGDDPIDPNEKLPPDILDEAK